MSALAKVETRGVNMKSWGKAFLMACVLSFVVILAWMRVCAMALASVTNRDWMSSFVEVLIGMNLALTLKSVREYWYEQYCEFSDVKIKVLSGCPGCNKEIRKKLVQKKNEFSYAFKTLLQYIAYLVYFLDAICVVALIFVLLLGSDRALIQDVAFPGCIGRCPDEWIPCLLSPVLVSLTSSMVYFACYVRKFYVYSTELVSKELKKQEVDYVGSLLGCFDGGEI